jgi:hypothetical protein
MMSQWSRLSSLRVDVVAKTRRFLASEAPAAATPTANAIAKRKKNNSPASDLSRLLNWKAPAINMPAAKWPQARDLVPGEQLLAETPLTPTKAATKRKTKKSTEAAAAASEPSASPSVALTDTTMQAASSTSQALRVLPPTAPSPSSAPSQIPSDALLQLNGTVNVPLARKPSARKTPTQTQCESEAAQAPPADEIVLFKASDPSAVLVAGLRAPPRGPTTRPRTAVKHEPSKAAEEPSSSPPQDAHVAAGKDGSAGRARAAANKAPRPASTAGKSSSHQTTPPDSSVDVSPTAPASTPPSQPKPVISPSRTANSSSSAARPATMTETASDATLVKGPRENFNPDATNSLPAIKQKRQRAVPSRSPMVLSATDSNTPHTNSPSSRFLSQAAPQTASLISQSDAEPEGVLPVNATMAPPRGPGINPCGIQLLPEPLRQQLFGNKVPPKRTLKHDHEMQEHLKKAQLWDRPTAVIPDTPQFTIPHMAGPDVAAHFRAIASQQASPYLELANSFVHEDDIASILPARPAAWLPCRGWMRYAPGAEPVAVACPSESAFVFDVETCVTDNEFPSLATAVSLQAWYLWCSPRLIEAITGPASSDPELIPLEPLNNREPRLAIGHFVGYDRQRTLEQYRLAGVCWRACACVRVCMYVCLCVCVCVFMGMGSISSGCASSRFFSWPSITWSFRKSFAIPPLLIHSLSRTETPLAFLDTASLHMATSGFSSQQRAEWKKITASHEETGPVSARACMFPWLGSCGVFVAFRSNETDRLAAFM